MDCVGSMVLCVDDGSKLLLELSWVVEGTGTNSCGHSRDGANVGPVEDCIIGDAVGSKLETLLELSCVDEGVGTNSCGHSSEGATVGTLEDSIVGDAVGAKLGNGVFRAALRDGDCESTSFGAALSILLLPGIG